MLRACCAQLARYGQPTPWLPLPGIVEDGPFPHPPMEFTTRPEALRQDDISSRHLADIVSRIGLPVRADEPLPPASAWTSQKNPASSPSTTE